MIEIMVVRDPDGFDQVTVWRDGVEVREELIQIHVDAGAGYSFEDWRENADWWAQDGRLSDAAREAAAEAFFDPPGYKYIDGFKVLGHRPFVCQTCGRIGTEDDLCVLGEECPADDCDGIIGHNWMEPE